MRKGFMTWAAIGCMMTVAVFTACNKEVEPEKPQKDTVPAKVSLTFTYMNTQDILDYCDVVVEYNDGTGAKTETVTSTNWTKTLTADLPVTFTFNRRVTLKTDKDITKADKISYTTGYSYEYEILNAAGESLDIMDSNRFTNSSSASGEKMVKLINEKKLDQINTFRVDKDGNKLK
ncbi:MAG: hypothetical protein J6T18_09690 [Bacteroidaceae bacterium]|nr:hypothetical protein [Bacteroidaceae bacterium]